MRLLLLSIPNHCFDVTVEADADVGKVSLQYPSNMSEYSSKHLMWTLYARR